MGLDELVFEMVYLKGMSCLYQPMYGCFNDETKLSRIVSLDNNELYEFEAMIRRNLKAQVEKFDNRFELIKDYIPINSNCLEYGCNIGYNTFLASGIEGVSITGVDKDKKVIPLAKVLLEYNKANKIGLDNINFIQADCSKYLEGKEDGFYDCILCLLIGHHILTDEFTKRLPQSYSELDGISDKLKESLDSFLDLISILKNKSKRFMIQLRLGVNGKHFSRKNIDYSLYKDDFFIDYLNDHFSFRNVIRIPATQYSYASPHPIYIFDS